MIAEIEITAASLRETRRLHGRTQQQVAELLGIDNTAISNIETGGRALSHAEKLVLEAYFLGRQIQPIR